MSTPIQNLPPKVSRKGIQKYFKKYGEYADGKPIDLPKVEDHTLPGWEDVEIGLRAYYPTLGKDPLPVIMFFHGGGFVVGDVNIYDRLCRHTALDTGAVVLSVEYRLAPEHPFPIPLEDCYAATCWAVSQAQRLGIDPARLAVMGDSAGGNLAAAVSMMARDRGGPAICQQVLVYPVTDLTLSTESSITKGKSYWLTRDTMEWYVGHYAPDPEVARQPYASMMLATKEQLTNLPPAYIITAEFDPLVDEGATYARNLEAAGNEVQYHEYKGMIHGFYMMGRMLRVCRKARRMLSKYLIQVFDRNQQKNLVG